MLPPSSGPTLALQLPSATSPRQGYHVNVLGSSLVARLKQRPAKECKEPKRQSAKPPKPVVAKPALKKTTAELGLRLEGLEDEEVHRNDDGQIAGSVGSETATRRRERPQRSRANSAASGDDQTLPRLKSGSRSPAGSRISSRRSLSAGQNQAKEDGRRPGACPSASSFAPRVSSYPVHVVKRDGVFQPADKYMPGRTGIREAGPATLWDYHTYVLPVMDSNSDNQSPRFSDPELSPRGMYISSGKKRMKVSWKTVLHPESDAQALVECGETLPESRQDTNPTPSTIAPASAGKQKRAQSVDNLAFRRPVYHSGSSRVSGVGLRWQVPTGSTENITNNSPRATDTPSYPLSQQHSTLTPIGTSKPMWSYLITHETATRHQKQDQPLLNSRAPVSKSRAKTSNASTSGQRHCRDVHPVSTAMEKNGTSVSKTRWTVPSSSASGLEAERSVRDRLQLVKRPGSLLLFEPAGRGTSNSAAQRFRQAMVAAGRADDIDDANKGEHGSDSYRTSKNRDKERDETDGSHLSGVNGRIGKGEELTQRTSGTNDDKTCSAQDDDQISSVSPTKSRSTFYN
ncbi:hypothetical protein PoB_003852900 [Plakobranchus ocellatus]|uniref:Uncharacterized protein n=1 Tax=Plakobranchus ocellatus TaxID=259542 RepID=A0AAV4B040_9GAST|nr:hypothetical protein PoB_003852900 [Plakobranchus ocellatus]